MQTYFTVALVFYHLSTKDSPVSSLNIAVT